MMKKQAYAYELARDLANQQLNPIELFEDTLAEAKNSKNVFISLTEERGRHEALLAHNRLTQGKAASILDGVPIAWKDNIDIQGYKTTNGTTSSDFKGLDEDAHIVDKASSMGLISVGKTNLSELAYSGLGINANFGTPFLIDNQGERLVPGGSSSGSAVAVREGIVSAAVGTDTAGSIRVPAAFNGLVGYKTSPSSHNRVGITPLSKTLDSVGTIAHCVMDCILVNSCLKGIAPTFSVPSKASEIHLIVDENVLESSQIEKQVLHNFNDTLAALKDAGAKITHQKLSSIAQTQHLITSNQWLGSMEAYLEFGHLLEKSTLLNLDRRISSRLKLAASKTLEQIAKTRYQQRLLMNKVSQELSNAALILPTVAHSAPDLKSLENDDDLYASTNLATLKITMLASFLSMPTFALPNGKNKRGRYTSFQISMPHMHDSKLERFALAIESIQIDDKVEGK